MSNGFETRQLPVDKLFAEPFVFSFPPFQRPYRWTIDEGETLLQDLLGAATADAPYFLGSIVVSGTSGEAVSVIDGRQRLTTLFILFAVLRDLEDAPEQSALHGLLAAGEGYRMVLGGTDERFFGQWIAAPGATRSSPLEGEVLPERHARLSEVARVFRERLTDHPARAAFASFVRERCELIMVRATDETQALRLFQVLNSRGMDLSQTDLARPRLFGELPAAEQLPAAEVWDRVDEKLGSAGVDTLLRALVFVLDGQWIGPDQPFADPLVAALHRYGVARFHAAELEPYAEAMHRILRGELQYADRKRNPNHLVRGLQWLGRSEREWQEWLPVALECVVRGGEDDERVYDLLRGVDRLFWLLFLAEIDEHQRRAVCAAVSADLRAGNDPLRADGPLRPDPQLSAAARAVLLRPFEKAHKRTAVIRRVELQLATEAGADLHPNIDDAVAEFVLPLSYPAASRAWAELFDREAHRECVALLGNAVLLHRPLDRSGAAAPYPEKKKLYTKYKWPRPFETVKDLVTRYPTWAPSRARERTTRLAEVLAAAWEL